MLFHFRARIVILADLHWHAQFRRHIAHYESQLGDGVCVFKLVEDAELAWFGRVFDRQAQAGDRVGQGQETAFLLALPEERQGVADDRLAAEALMLADTLSKSSRCAASSSPISASRAETTLHEIGGRSPKS